MNRILINTKTRCSLQKLQAEYHDKYSSTEFLLHEENYIIDSFNLLFEDISFYFKEQLIMLDGYFKDADNHIHNINNKLAKKNSNYELLTQSFNIDYNKVFDKVRQQAKKDENSIISISHELITSNKKTGVCLLKSSTKSKQKFQPEDCHYLDLVKLKFLDIKKTQTIPDYLFSKDYKELSFEEYTKLIESLEITENKKNGIARTLELYHHLLAKAKNCFVYFIRPRVAHNFYNGTAVIFLTRALTEVEFNSLSSFLNSMLCETAIARLKLSVANKAISKTLEATGSWTWGARTELTNMITDSKGYKKVSKEIQQLKDNLRKAVIDIFKDKTLNDEINNAAIKAKNEFIDFIQNKYETSNISFTIQADYSKAYHKDNNSKNIDTNSGFKEQMKNVLIARRTLLLLVYLNDNNKIKFNDSLKHYYQKLPMYVINTFDTHIFSTEKTINVNGSSKDFLTEVNYRKKISSLGLCSKKGSTTQAKIQIQYSTGYIAPEEIAWLNEQLNTQITDNNEGYQFVS